VQYLGLTLCPTGLYCNRPDGRRQGRAEGRGWETLSAEWRDDKGQRGLRPNLSHLRLRSGFALPPSGMDKLRTLVQHQQQPRTNTNPGLKRVVRSFSGRFDDNGNYTLPTKSGSIFIFEPKAPNANRSKVGRVLFNGVTIQANGMDKLYFGVMEEYGIVHLRGAGTATMPDGKVFDLK